MTGLVYAGRTPVTGDPTTSMLNRSAVGTVVSGITPNIASVQAEALSSVVLAGGAGNQASTAIASVAYVDQQDAQFVMPTLPQNSPYSSYYQQQDALNIPNTTAYVPATVANAATAGIPNGIATLDGSGLIPLSQMPNMGTGFVRGPYGVNPVTGSLQWPAASGGSTTPVNIANWSISGSVVSFRPMVFLTVDVVSFWEQVNIEVYITQATSVPAFSSAGTLIAQGVGRPFYNDQQPILVTNVPDALGKNPTNLSPPLLTYNNIWVSAWMNGLQGRVMSPNTNGATGGAYPASVALAPSSGSMVGALFLWRGAE